MENLLVTNINRHTKNTYMYINKNYSNVIGMAQVLGTPVDAQTHLTAATMQLMHTLVYPATGSKHWSTLQQVQSV